MGQCLENLVINVIKNKKKQENQTPLSTVSVGLLQRPSGKKNCNIKTQTIRILLDSGSSGCLIAQKAARKLNKRKTEESKWSTKAGTFKTDKVAIVSFCLYELHPDKQITWEMHVDHTDQLSKYDMIIGRDLLMTLGIDLLFSTKEIQWDNATAPMRDPDTLEEKSKNQLEHEVFGIDPTEEDIIQRMTEQKYSPADLPTEV